ncbi:MAG: hypothetical protein ACP5LQ_06155 [Candidatus Methanodesulfokora sp.]
MIHLTLKSMKPGFERGRYIGPIVLSEIKLDRAFLVEEEEGEFEYKRISSSDQNLIVVEIETEIYPDDFPMKIDEILNFVRRKGLENEFNSWVISFGAWIEELMDPDLCTSIMLLDDFSKADVLFGLFRDLNPVKNIRSFFDEEEGPSSDVPFISFRYKNVEFYVLSRPLFIKGEQKIRLDRDEIEDAFRTFEDIIRRLTN